MRAALDQAWEALPLDQRTAETRERIAQAVVNLATQWERDTVQLGAVRTAIAMRKTRFISNETNLSRGYGARLRCS